MADTNERLEQIERRLAAVEGALRKVLAEQPAPQTRVEAPTAPPKFIPTQYPRESSNWSQPNSVPQLSATTLLGWGGVAALVLATAYLIRLAVDTGWLTPLRQISLAGAFGIALVAAGLILRTRYHRYASLLPGGGIVVLYLTVFGAHIVHQLISPSVAIAGVMAISIAALALQRLFASTAYLLFAVIGSYIAPIMLQPAFGNPTDIALYFAAWDLLFCGAAWYFRQRMPYLIASYLAFASYDLSWRLMGSSMWVWAATFQASQLLVFTAATMLHTRRLGVPLTINQAFAHVPPLVFFYIIECSILFRFAPAAAPYLAAASALPILAAYFLARTQGDGDGRPGELIVSSYCALVLFHALYLEIVPSGFHILAGTTALGILVAVAARRWFVIERFWPVAVSLSLMAVLTILQLAFDVEVNGEWGWEILILVNAALMYAIYAARNEAGRLKEHAAILLYVGHALVILAPIHYDANRLIVSFVWGVTAVASLLIAIQRVDKTLAQSALLMFAAFAAKVVFFDLSNRAPLLRIGSLVVLGISLYSGGLLYQRLLSRISAPATN